MQSNSINIVGACQCGTLVAIMLARHGYDVDVYERFTDPRIQDAEAEQLANASAIAAMTTVSERLVPIEFVRDGLAVHTS